MITVLFIDDDPRSSEHAKKFLIQPGGFDVKSAVSSEEALQYLKDQEFDAIVSGHRVPGMDAIGLLKAVRERYGSVPFIIFTNDGNEKVEIEALSNGADFYIRKGSEPQARFARIAALLRHSVSRKQAEAALVASEELFRGIAERSGDLIFILNKDMSPTYVSPSARQIIGYEPDELAGRPKEFAADTIFADCRSIAMQALEANFRGESVDSLEMQIRRKDGTPVMVSVHAIPVMKDGILSGAQVTMRDISEGERVKQDLSESEKSFRTIFRNSPYPIAINSMPDGRFLAVNKALVTASDFTDDELLGKNHLELGLISVTESAKLVARFAAGGNRLENVPLALTGKNGKSINVLFSTIPITFRGRPAILTITVEVTKLREVESELLVRNRQLNTMIERLTVTEKELQENVSELRRNEQDLRASETKFRALVQNTLDGILIIGFSGTIHFLNRAVGQIVELDDYQEAEGSRNVMEFVAPESRDDVLEDFRKVAGGTDSYIALYKIITAKGRDVWIESIGKRIPFGDSEAILISIRDVTERRRAEEALRESERKFSAVFNKNPVSLTLVSASDGTFVDVNEAFLEKTGFSRSEVIGRTAEDICLFADPAEYIRMVSKIRNERALDGMELRCRIKSGDVRTCRFSSGIIHMGGIPLVLSTVEDITDRKAGEEAVRAMVAGMVGVVGIESLDRISASISGWLGAECVMIGEIEPDGDTIRVLSMLLDGEMVTDYSYTLRGTPCEKTADKGFCHYPDEVAKSFPESEDLKKLNIRGYAGTPLRNRNGKVIGILCILSRHPLALPTQAREIIDIIAVKAAAEIERSRLEHSLRRSRQQREDAMDIASLVNWEYDVATGFFTFDNRFYALYGTTAEREGGTRMPAEVYAREFLPPEERGLVAAEIKKAMKTTDPDFVSQIEHRIIRRDGGIRHIVVRYRITKDAAGRTIKTHGANQDITPQKVAEAALQKSEEKLRRITDHAPDMIYRMSVPDGKYEYVSPASVALTGYTPDEFYADPAIMWRQIHPAWKSYLKEQWQGLLDNNVPPTYEFQIIDRGGNVRWVNQRNMLIIGESGLPVAIEGIVTDTTRQKEAEAELRQSEERYRAVSENAGSWIWETDAEGLYVYSNKAVERILGYRPDELIGKKNFYDLFEPEAMDEQKDIALAVFRRHEPFHNFTNINSHRNGTPVILNTSGTPLFDEHGHLTGYCGVDEDITERKRAEAALKRTNHQLSLMTGITRHDILNRITVMLGYLAIANKRCTDPAVTVYLKHMEETIDTIKSQIEFTRVYQNLGIHQPQWVELDTMIPHANIPITIAINADVQGISVFADPMLEKVFFNLLDNSVRHGQRVTEISVSAHKSSGDLIVVWNDNGAGIPDDEKEVIFDRGYGKNTGLGLFLVREILALTGISISETGIAGKGARFEIHVPKGIYRLDPDRWLP